MKIGEVEIKGISGREIRCQTTYHHRFAVAYYNDTACCAECLGDHFLNGENNRELIGHLLVGLIKD
ncbi:MAG: hypothetical protein ABSD59_20965 [Terracidiphilus sp.]